MPQWQAPVALLALAPLGALIVLLYLLRLRRREVTVPSTLLWRRAAQDVQANVPFQRLRRSLLLLLQLLALLLLVLCLGGPYVLSRSTAGHSLVLVLDASGSMKATDVAGSRFDEARREALRRVAEMGRTDEIAIIVCGLRPQVACSFSHDRRRLRRVLEAAQPTDGPTRLRDGLRLAANLARRRENALICLFSDGAWSSLENLGPEEVHFVPIGKRSENLALLAFEAERDRQGRQALFVRVGNTGSAPRRCTLSLYHEDQFLYATHLTVPACGSRIVTFEARVARPGLLQARIDDNDDLAADNVAYAVAQDESRTRVLLVTVDNLFLQQGLAILPGVSVYQTTTLDAAGLAAAAEQYDVIVLDRVPLAAAPTRGGYLLFDALGPDGPAQATGTLCTPAITRWDSTHPVLAHVNLGDLQISQARGMQPAEQARSIAEAGSVPVMVVQDTPGLRMVACGLDLLDTDLPLRVAFPLLLRNAVDWLSAVSGADRVMSVRPGAPLRALVKNDEAVVELALPDRRRVQLTPLNGEAVFPDTNRVGVYEMRTGELMRRWAVDMRDPEESNLLPRGKLEVGGRPITGHEQLPLGMKPVWPWLALLALAVLLVEWHLYHRRL